MTNSSPKSGQNPDKRAARNEKVLAQLVNAIAVSRGEFKLILAIADSATARNDWTEATEKKCIEGQNLNVACFWLNTKKQNIDLLDTLQSKIAIEKGNREILDCIIIPNIPDLEDVEKFWVLANQSRDRLRQTINCPIVLWLNSQTLEKMVRLASDLHSWSTSKRFHLSSQDHRQNLEFGIKSLFENLRTIAFEEEVLAEDLIISHSQRQELTFSYEVIKSDINAGIDQEFVVLSRVFIAFLKGRHALHRSELEFASNQFKVAEIEAIKLSSEQRDDALGWIKLHQGIVALYQAESSPWPIDRIDEIWDLFSQSAQFRFKNAKVEPPMSRDDLLGLEWEFMRRLSARRKATQARRSGQFDEEIRILESIQHQLFFEFPCLHLNALQRLRELYREHNKDYLEAFQVHRQCQILERRFGLRSFIGVSRLVPLRIDGSVEAVPPEIEFSGRAEDLEAIIQKIRGIDTKLVVLCGASGVGKSSLVNAGLLPRIPREKFEQGRVGVAIALRQYEHWANDLRVGVAQQLKPFGMNPCEDADDCLAIGVDLRGLAGKHREVVVVLDQFEEFFFAHPDPVEQRQLFEMLGEWFNDPDLGALTVVLSLRSDYLHLLLPCNRMESMGAIGGDILGRRVLYELGNLSPERAGRMLERLAPLMEEGLRGRLVADLSAELGVVRPIELQIVGGALGDVGDSGFGELCRAGGGV